ncbi:thiocillin family RiPP [Streptomyces sp. ISL-10]|uniref:thiocillin family RiPP n=1 Tax=Streptomyces sp. ISL-10 TaxID=2819172 RepID=UPI001BEB3FB4|nr:thiocillin family RiPP [Streptomyces sp. ISL-10]MBT2365432.1 thiocillin family RiPP [Streptomyces sp. ISL-10]
MTDLDLHLDAETPELEVLPDTHSAAVASCAGSVGSAGSFSTPAGCFGTVGTASSA